MRRSLCIILLCAAAANASGQSLGVFESRSDVGTVLHAGSAQFDAETGTYSLSGSGANMWFAEDDFQFVWKKVSGDVSLAADITLDDGPDHHRKAALMIRQSLDADSAYADASVHGDGLTSLQFRTAKGEATHEIESNASGPKRLQIEKRGDTFFLWIGSGESDMQFAGGSIVVPLQAPFYVGLGVCAHNKDAVERAVFSNVEMRVGGADRNSAGRYNTLETIAVSSTDARVAYTGKEKIGSPAWSPDGKSLIFQADGKTEQVAYMGGTPEPASVTVSQQGAPQESFTQQSPDGKFVASVSKDESGAFVVLKVASNETKQSRILATYEGPLDAPAWSPDGKRLAFVSQQVVQK